MLRPVPSRPPGPVDPAEAVRHVAAELPALDAPAAAALALVDLVGHDRASVASERELSPEELGVALARARTALRRAMHPLPGSGWCERAERMLSDRLDGELGDLGEARLAAHVANCGRCVEHERRLAQAQDRLVAGFVASHPAAGAAAPAGVAAATPPALSVVEQPAERVAAPAVGPATASRPAPPTRAPRALPVWGMLLMPALALVTTLLAVAALLALSVL